MADFNPDMQQPVEPVQARPTASAPQQEAKKIPEPPQYLLDTLNETVCQTISRDLKLVFQRTFQVIWIFGRPSNPEVYEQWDIFGPLFYALALSLLYYFSYIKKMTGAEFILPLTICIIFILGFIVALNIICIGGKANVMGTIALLGYCCAPLVLGAIVAIIIVYVGVNPAWVGNLIVGLIAAACAIWSLFAIFGFFRNIVPRGKVIMGVYPVIFYFVVLAMLMIIPVIQPEKVDPVDPPKV